MNKKTTFADWLDEKIKDNGLNNSVFEFSAATIGAYRNSRTMPDIDKFKSICKTLKFKFSVKIYKQFRSNFVRNYKR